ncbi:MAG TPA: hypothetical protein VEU96_30985 [Bryobacteraceae bacterium]|nr:hypothetical protein [Bryobacteraceae bacterium]
MTKPTAELTVGVWNAPEVRLTVEYTVEVMEEIRAAVSDGLQQLAHGGLEVGGVLFGSRRDDSIRILKWRPIACEHAEGPTLRLSTRDRIGLTRQLEVAKSDPDLAGLQPLGWFLSHCRSDIFLTVSDQEIYNGFFSEPWQVTLVLRPTRLGPARAGFFAREADGALKSDASYKDFTVEPMHRPPPSGERRAVPRRSLPIAPQAKPEPRAAPRPALEPLRPVEPPRFLQERRRSAPSAQWLWAIPGCLAMLIVGALINQQFSTPANPPFSFRAYNSRDAVQVEWDANSTTVRSARQAVLEMKEGDETRKYPLTAAQLRTGSATYPRQGADVELRLTVYPESGAPVQEFARLVGPPSGPSTTERDQLEAEVNRLKEELRRERQKKKPAKTTAP